MALTFKNVSVALAVALAAQLYASVALAAPPANIRGVWTAQVNQEEVTLEITSQGASGTCRQITGTISIAPIQGIYCPSTGHFLILHKNIASNDTVRVFTGNVSDRVVGQPDRMGGTVTVVNIAFGPFGVQSFSATKE
jgi:hypothetical protein